MAYALTWLPGVLRAAGCRVVEVDGWQTRGLGEIGPIKGWCLHHTAGPKKIVGTPALGIVTNGRPAFTANGRHYPKLAGPLSQTYLAADGTWYIVAAGRSNHAGRGEWQGIVNGNSELIGTEAENPGDGSAWPQVQTDEYVRGVAAGLRHLGLDDVFACGHKEYALPRGRKIDPTLDMIAFRASIEAINGNLPIRNVPSTDPTRAMLRKGDRGNSVRELQTRLGIAADGAFGPATHAAVIAFQSAHGLVADGLVGPKTWEALGI